MNRKYTPYTNTVQNTLDKYQCIHHPDFQNCRTAQVERASKGSPDPTFCGKGSLDEIIQHPVQLQGLMELNPDKNIYSYVYWATFFPS